MPGCIWARQFISAYPNSTPLCHAPRVHPCAQHPYQQAQGKAAEGDRHTTVAYSRGTLRTVGMKGSASGALVICSELSCVKHVNMFNLLNHPIWGSFEPYQNFSIWQMCRPSSLAPNELRLWLSISLPKCICPAKVYTAVEQRLTVRQLLVICSLRWKLHG